MNNQALKWHRELQLSRSGATGNGNYIAERHRKNNQVKNLSDKDKTFQETRRYFNLSLPKRDKEAVDMGGWIAMSAQGKRIRDIVAKRVKYSNGSISSGDFSVTYDSKKKEYCLPLNKGCLLDWLAKGISFNHEPFADPHSQIVIKIADKLEMDRAYIRNLYQGWDLFFAKRSDLLFARAKGVKGANEEQVVRAIFDGYLIAKSLCVSMETN